MSECQISYEPHRGILTGEIRMRLEPKDKRLGIAPIESTITLDGCDIRRAGAQPAFSGFKVPDTRAQAVVRLIREETPMSVTIWIQQGSLPGMDGGEPQQPTTQGETPHTEAIEIKCKGMKLAYLKAVLVCEGAGAWRLGYEAQCGNYSQIKDAKDGPAFDSRTAALNALHFSASTWIDSIELTGSADQKRALSARKASWWSQVKEVIDAKVREGQPAEVPFDEDPPRDERLETSDEPGEEDDPGDEEEDDGQD